VAGRQRSRRAVDLFDKSNYWRDARAMTDPAPRTDAIDRLRAFNRFYTKRIGALSATLLGSRFNLTEARVLFEIGHRPGTTAKAIGAELGLDPGYLSRTLRHLVTDGLVVMTKSSQDGRSRDLVLSDAGRTALAELEHLSREAIASMLSALPDADRTAVTLAAETMMRHLGGDALPAIELRAHAPGDMGWIVERHAMLYAREYGFDGRFEAMVAEIAASFLRSHAPAFECCRIAVRGTERVGSVMVVRSDEETAKLRLLLVEPSARGTGLGRRLLEESLAFARDAGYRRMVLWTNDILVPARRLYETAGFMRRDTAEHADFGPRVTGETWMRDL